MLSIIVPTYGHEKYIAKALDSILMQQTHYRFEVLVGDDASPDGTREILKEYERRYPDVFTMFYRETNMRQQGKSNAGDLKRRARGKYTIVLEGDDFWLDPLKIEKQVSFLETHPEYIAVAHNCLVVGEDSEPNGETYPECKETEYTLRHFMYDILPGQLATIMTRNFIKYHMFDTSLLYKGLSPGDRLLDFVLVTHGRVYCMQEKMTAYRHVLKGGTSVSANYKLDYAKEEHWFHELLLYARSLKQPEAIQCAETWYLAMHMYFLRLRKITLKEFFSHIGCLEHKCSALFHYGASKVYKMRNKT